MSDASITRILDAIDGLRTEVAGLKVTVNDLKEDVHEYNAVKDRVFQLEADKKACDEKLTAIKDNCAAVQSGKKTRVNRWIALAFSVMGGVLLMLLGFIFELLKKLGG